MMLLIEQTEEFADWLGSVRDSRGKTRILARISAMGHGHFGDSKAVGDGIMEMRLHTGPGYRLYYNRVGSTVYLLLLGGDKSTQTQDITKAKKIAQDYANEEDRMKED